MHPDDHVCLCFRVSLRKIRTYLKQENPPVASLISECLGAGTGCQWCVPFLKELHRQHAENDPRSPDGQPDLAISPEQYAKSRLAFHKTGERDITPHPPPITNPAPPNTPPENPREPPHTS